MLLRIARTRTNVVFKQVTGVSPARKSTKNLVANSLLRTCICRKPSRNAPETIGHKIISVTSPALAFLIDDAPPFSGAQNITASSTSRLGETETLSMAAYRSASSILYARGLFPLAFFLYSFFFLESRTHCIYTALAQFDAHFLPPYIPQRVACLSLSATDAFEQ